MTEWLLLGLSLLLVFSCGVFGAAEYSLVTVDRATVERAAEAGDKRSKGTLAALRTLSTQLSGAQLGITITNLAIGFLAEPALGKILHDPLESLGLTGGALRGISYAVALTLSTIVTMLLGELVPKKLAIALPQQVAAHTQLLMRTFTTSMAWPIRTLNSVANAILRAVGVEPQEELRSARSPLELRSLVLRSAQQGALGDETADLVARSIAFGDRTAADVRTPRVRVHFLEGRDSALDVIDAARQTGHSRFPVIGRSPDDILGIVHVKQAVSVEPDRRRNARLSDLADPATTVPDSIELDPLLTLLREQGMQMAIVVDEYGGTDGVVTLEDLVEEIVGDIADEHDRLSARSRHRRDGTWSLSGLLRPDEVEEQTEIALPEGEDYETIAGLIHAELGRIAERGDEVVLHLERRGDGDEESERVTLRVERMEGRRIDRVSLTVESEGGVVMNPGLAIALTVVLLALNALFVGAEFALISARRTQLEPRVQAGSAAARMALRAIESLTLVIAAAQLGITICSLGLGAVGEPAIAHLLEPLFKGLNLPDGLVHPISFVIAMTIVVFLHVVLGEMVPKNLALVGPERAALLLGPFMLAVIAILRPFVVLLNGAADLIIRILRVEPRSEVASTYSHDEVAGLVEESRREGLLDDHEYGLVSGALVFYEGTIDRVLLPRDGLVTISPSATPVEVEQACAATGFSRFPVADAEGNITGYLHIKDVLETDEASRHEAIADKWVRPLATVVTGSGLHEALRTMQLRGSHMARVADKSGDVLGVIMLEDVLEELVGEIRSAERA